MSATISSERSKIKTSYHLAFSISVPSLTVDSSLIRTGLQLIKISLLKIRLLILKYWVACYHSTPICRGYYMAACR